MQPTKRKRQKENRARRRASERRSTRFKNIRRRMVQIIVIAAVVIGAVTISSTISNRERELQFSTMYERLRSFPTACAAAQPATANLVQYEEPAELGINGAFSATLVTSCGDILIELDADAAPANVNSFVFLAEEGFYDGTAFHRLLPDFLLEGGDPTAEGDGGPGYAVTDEFPPRPFTYEEGIVAMANSGPRTGGGRFFIILGSRGEVLGPNFSVIGKVVGSEATLDRIRAVETGGPGREESTPLQTIYIEQVIVTR